MRGVFKFVLLFIVATGAGAAQTVTLNDAVNTGCVISATNPCPRAGLNLGQPSGAYPFFKNLLAFANPGFEPLLMQQIYQFTGSAGYSSTTHFQWDVSNTQFEGYDLNQWAGASFTVTQGCYSGATGCTGGGGTGDPAFGCTGTILSSSAATGGFGPQFVINSTTNQGSTGCAGALGIPGQIITVSSSTSQSTVLPSTNGWPAAISTTGTATVTAEDTDLCGAPCGQQAALITAPAGSTATITVSNTAYSTGGALKTILFNGNYPISFWAKSVSGSTTPVTVTVAVRNGTGATCTYSPTLTTSWAQYSHTCTFAETATPSDPFNVLVQFAGAANATWELDNLSLTDGSTNPTVYSDTMINAIRAWCQTAANTTGPGCTLRYGPAPDSETMANWVKPQMTHQPSAESFSTAFSTGYFTLKTGIYDFLQLCAYVGATPVLMVPVTITNADVQNLMDFLQDPNGSTTYGAIRQSLGQSAAWVGQAGSPFSVIYLEFGNENWNAIFIGHVLTGHAGVPNIYYDYGLRMSAVMASARARQTAQSYNQNVTKWDATALTGDSGNYPYLLAYTCGQPTYPSGACTTGGADSVEIQGYYGVNIGNTSNANCSTAGSTNATCLLYGPTSTEPWSNIHDPASSSGWNQSLAAISAVSKCGPVHTAACAVDMYEGGMSPDGSNTSTSGPFTQAISDIFTQTGWHGAVDTMQFAENDQAGLLFQNEYQAQQYYFAQGGVNVHIWGSLIDNGGDCSSTNASLFGGSYCPRPQMLGAMIYNYCKIGQEVSTSWTSNPTYNLPANSNGVNAINNVPVLKSYEFKSGTKRCLILVNSDVFSSYPVTIAGTNTPTTATTYQLAPPALTATNETANLGNTSGTVAAVFNVLTSNVNVASGITLPAFSATALEWTTGTNPQASAPTFSPPAGTYTGTQTVTISTTSSGAIICYNTTGSPATNGTTGCATGTLYSGPVTVAASETLYAVAGGTGYTDSPVASAAYVINPPATTAPVVISGSVVLRGVTI